MSSGHWLKLREYDIDDICYICDQQFGKKQAIYKAPCGHKFHNNCLSRWCEGQITIDDIRTPYNILCRGGVKGGKHKKDKPSFCKNKKMSENEFENPFYDRTDPTNSQCPVCNRDLDYSCTDVWAFKEKALGDSDEILLFDGDKHLNEVYNSQSTEGGRKMRRKTIKKRKNNLNKKTQKRRTSKK